MTPATETKVATIVALTLIAISPAIMATYPFVAAGCFALGSSIATAYNVRTAHDRAASRNSVAPKP